MLAPPGQRRLLVAAILLLTLAFASVADARPAKQPWPPADGAGQLFVHFGEEHWNDDDSDITLPAVVASAALYEPDLVTMSGDKDNNGTADQLQRWEQIMSAFDQAGVPYLAGVGNHDRDFPLLPGTAGLITPGVQASLENYRAQFADRPYPFGDAAPYPGIGPARPASDPPGASSHYYADLGKVRWIFLDNSCWGIRDCDPVQRPSFPDAEGLTSQFEFLEHKAREASDAGRLVFVVMHIPTDDPRDQSYIDATSFDHVMGKGITPARADNAEFEHIAATAGVDGVFLGHIKGQWTYRGEGGVPYYIDGGAGGELYTDGPLGVDHGYWHGFRLIRVRGGSVSTDVVPILDPGGIEITAPPDVATGDRVELHATATLTKAIGESIELELRDPDPVAPTGRDGALASFGNFLLHRGGMMLVPALALILALALNAMPPIRRRSAAIAPLAGVIVVGGLGAAALAAEDVPTSTPKDSLPNPARIWTSTEPLVLAPVASDSDDPRRAKRTQTADGAFKARCPGKARLKVTSGFEESGRVIEVASENGPIVKGARVRGGRAVVGLEQRAEVLVRVRDRRGKVVREVAHRCARRGVHAFRWDGRVARGDGLAEARPGRYRLELLVRSDRRPLLRAQSIRVR